MNFDWIWKSVLIIAAGTLLLRFSGRRSISQMTMSTTVIMISIGTLLIQPVSGKNIWVTIAIATLLILTLIVLEYFQLKSDKIETFLTGKSLVVIENGMIHEKNLKKLRLTVDKLEMRLRQAGIERIENVNWATIEPSGQLGYLLKDHKQYATKEDIQKIINILNSISDIQNSPILKPSNQEQSNIFQEVRLKDHIKDPPDHLN